MKSILGGALCVVLVAWLLFVFTTTDPCERVARGAAPVRIAFDTARWASKNWLSTDARIDMIRWSIDGDAATKRFLSRQFYGTAPVCGLAAASTDAKDAQ